MTIEFSCKYCGNEMTVDKKHAGKRGDCPTCGRMFTVPNNSTHSPVIYENNEFFKSERLNQLFSDFLDEYEDKIIQKQIVHDAGNTLLSLDIRTKAFRSQVINLLILKNDTEEWLHAFTRIGEVTDRDEIVGIIASGQRTLCPTYSISYNDGVFRMSHSRRIRNIDKDAFYDMTIKLAFVADNIEEDVFGVDQS